MKILFVSNLFPDSDHPVWGQINATLLHHLAKRCEVRVLALRSTLPMLGFKVRRLKPRAEDELLKPAYAPVWYLPKVGSRFNHRLIGAGALPVLRRLRKEFNYDVILCSWLYPDVCGLARVLPRLGVPMVAISQGTDVHVYLDIPVRRKLIVDTVSRLPGTITRSKDLAKRLVDAGVPESRLHPIYNGVDQEVFQPGDRAAARRELKIPADDKVILYVGNFLPIKNPLLLVRALSEVKADSRTANCRLIMIGAGPLLETAKAEAAAMETSEQIDFVGRKSSGEVARYMQAANVLCIPSNNEGVPNVAFEAMACGLPIVGTKVGGIPEVVCEDFLGRLVGKGDQGALTVALKDLLTEPADSRRITDYARQFSWEKTVDAYLEVLQRAVSS